MKIIYCITATVNSGGTERIVLGKANWLANNGFEVVIVTTDQRGRMPYYPIDSKIKCVDLDINYDHEGNLSYIGKVFQRRRNLKLHKERLAKLLKQENADITISTFGNEYSFLYKLADRSKKVIEIHSCRWFRLRGYNKNWLFYLSKKYLTYLDKKYVCKYDAFICLTHEDKKHWGDSLSNIYVIPNFIENNSADIHYNVNGKQAIAVGRLSYEKGYDRLIAAWAIVSAGHNDWTLNIFGDGPLRDELSEMIAKLGLGNSVRICKPVKDIFKEYAQSAFLILTSRYEGLPMVLLEAMSVGIPVVSFDFECGPKDLIINDANGCLVPDGDIGLLANCITRLIDNAELRQSMGQAAYQTSLSYNKSAIMQKWVTLFKSLQCKNG